MRVFHNKRAIELSINFIVMLILAIATFAGGMLFLSKFFGKAQEMRGTLDSQTQREIEKLLDSGSPVVIPISTKEIFRNKFDTFGAGILAKFNGQYTLTVSQSSSGSAFTKDKQPITWNMQDWKIQPSATQTIHLNKNEKGKILIGMTVPNNAPVGTYLLTITVKAVPDDNTLPTLDPYDNPLQMIVQVP
jgi:hypothetical protein